MTYVEDDQVRQDRGRCDENYLVNIQTLSRTLENTGDTKGQNRDWLQNPAESNNTGENTPTHIIQT